MAATSSKRRSFYADLDHLKKCFDQVDHAKSGFIGYSELTKLVETMPDTGSSVVSELMEKLDRDKDGRVSFNDFVWLFEHEREASSKKQKMDHEITSTPKQYVEPAPNLDDSFGMDTGDVVLRRNNRRMTLPARLQKRSRELPYLSPIQPQPSPVSLRPPSNDLTDLASQMKYLTDANESTDSPQLKRSSKVLSWIESEDLLFEDTGVGQQREKELPSPPLSPTRGQDDASHVGTILESVCNSSEVNSKTIAKLCDHVKADQQEQQELLALLRHLDKDRKGFVSVTEFAKGLQAIGNSSSVGTSTPNYQGLPRRAFSEITPPRLSEPFSTPSAQTSKPPPPTSSQPSSAYYGVLTAIDPNQSGFVKVDDVINYWQTIGIEAPHNESLDNIVSEAVPVDPSGRVSIGDLTATLENSILTEGKKQSAVLRQAALKSFKDEISTLRTHIQQVALERDKLKTSLNRTVEEKQKLIAEGDEHVDMVTKKSEKEKKEQAEKFLERIKEVEKTKQQDALQFQERASNAIKDLEAKMKELKGEEEKLREELKFAQEDSNEVTQQLLMARKDLGKKDRTIAMLQKELGNRSEHDIIYDESHSHRVVELENELSDKGELISDLQDKLRAIQDDYDELKAENERMRQKNMSQKRSMQKSQSLPNAYVGQRRRSKHNRPLSGSHFHKRSMPLHPHIPTSMDLDLAVQRENHPVLLEEEEKEECDNEDFLLSHLPLPTPEKEVVEPVVEPVQEPEEEIPAMISEEDTTTESDDDFAKSTTSLMEEFRQERLATLERKRSKDINAQLEMERRKHQEIVTQLKEDNARLEEFAESQQDQVLKLEEEKSQLADSLKEQEYELESERKSHEVEVNILSRKLENAESEVEKLETELNDKQRQLQEDYEAKLLSANAKAESKISSLQSDLKLMQSTMADHNTLQKEITELKEKLESQKKESLRKSSNAISLLESKHKEQSKAMKEKHTAVVEKLQERMTVSVRRERSLKEKLQRSNEEVQALLDQVHDLRERGTAYEKQISMLEASEAKYLNELSQLKTDVIKLQGEISLMKNAAIAYKNKISSLKAELQKESEFDDYLALPTGSRRSSTSSESSKHGDIITKMRLQLEELQNALESKSIGEQTGEIDTMAELELIHKLVADASSLDTEVQRLRRGISAERLSHLQICAQKDEHLRSFQADQNNQKELVKTLTLEVSEDITNRINTLQKNCSQFIGGCRSKLDGVILQLATITKAFGDADIRHAAEIDTLTSKLDLSHNEIRVYKEELDRVHLQLETSQHDLDELTEVRDQLTKMHQDKEVEMDKLRSRLEQIKDRNHAADVVPSVSRNVKVDADSGQVITEQDDSQTLLLKEETIASLREEIDQLKQAESRGKMMSDEASRKLLEREREMKKVKQDVENFQRRISELETKLQQQEIESVTQRKELATTKQSLLLVREELKTSKDMLELQHRDSMKELKRKHTSELRSSQEVLTRNTSEARKLYGRLMEVNKSERFMPEYAMELSHSQIMMESTKQVEKVSEQFSKQERLYNDLEATLAEKLEEHEVFESQFTAEHEEEVRALRQQKQQLMKQLEEVREQYQTILDDQEEQNNLTLQELMNNKSDIEKQLKNKTEETFHIYQQVADLHEEKKVLIDIMKQLCIEAGRNIDIV